MQAELETFMPRYWHKGVGRTSSYDRFRAAKPSIVHLGLPFIFFPSQLREDSRKMFWIWSIMSGQCVIGNFHSKCNPRAPQKTSGELPFHSFICPRAIWRRKVMAYNCVHGEAHHQLQCKMDFLIYIQPFHASKASDPFG